MYNVCMYVYTYIYYIIYTHIHTYIGVLASLAAGHVLAARGLGPSS